MKINSEKSIQEIADNIELHAGTYNLSIIGSVKFNDFSKGLKDEVTQHDALNVLNGIAYKGEPNILYLTGKNWDKLFKVRILKK